MPDLPRKKVGIVACSGEELPEGTVTRQAALEVLESLRPADTVTICLPLYLAGGEGDRAFARFYPTIAVDGCGLRCAARATEMYSGKPAAGLVISDLNTELGLPKPQGKRWLDDAGRQIARAAAERIAQQVDRLLEEPWSRTAANASELAPVANEAAGTSQSSCLCASDIPSGVVRVQDKERTLVALPLIFEQFKADGKGVSAGVAAELLEAVMVYNPTPQELQAGLAEALLSAYAVFLKDQEQTR